MVKIKSDSDDRKARANIFIPKTISESIRISPDNEDRIALIETEGSPALESDLKYILVYVGNYDLSRPEITPFL